MVIIFVLVLVTKRALDSAAHSRNEQFHAR